MRRNRFSVVLTLLVLLVAVASASVHGFEFTGKIGSATPGTSVRGTALSLDGKHLYVAGVQAMSVWKYDVATGEIVASVNLAAINPGAYGKAVYVAQNGHVWAPGTVPELYEFDADLTLVAKYDLRPFGIQNPEGALVLPDGSIIVTNRAGNVGIFKFQVVNGSIEPVAEFGKDGFVTLGSDLRQPAVAADGSILVGDFASTTIYKVDATTGSASTFASGVTNPYHLATDASGNVYAVHYGNSVALTVLDASGKVISTSTTAELGIASEASGVAVSADGGTVYILDQRPADGGGARVYSK